MASPRRCPPIFSHAMMVLIVVMMGAAATAVQIVLAQPVLAQLPATQLSATQPPATQPPRPEIPEKLPTALENGAVRPDAFYLINNSGNLIFIPNFRYEEFETLIKQQKLTADPKLPSFSIQQVNLRGELRGDAVYWTVSIGAQLANDSNGVVAIPLNFRDFHLVGEPKFEGNGEQLLELSPSDPTQPQLGYQWWIRSDQGSQHRLEMSMVSRVVPAGDRQTVPVALPIAPTRIQCVGFGKDVELSVQGQGNETVSKIEMGEGNREYQVNCSGGSLNLVWQSVGVATRLAALEVQSTTKLEVQPTGVPWRGLTTLTLRGGGEPIPSQFEIQMPQGAQWQAPRSDNGTAERYRISQVAEPPSPPAAPTEKSDGPRLMVEVFQPTNDLPAQIAIEWLWTPPSVASSVSQVIVGAPRVPAADRHDGIIELLYPSSYRVLAVGLESTVSLFQGPSVGATEQSVSRFRFDRQPGKIRATLRSDIGELRWRPVYIIEVSRQRLNLIGLLDFPVDPTQTPLIEIAPKNWSIVDAQQMPNGVPLRIEAGSPERLMIEGTATGTTDISRPTYWKVLATRELTGEASQSLAIEIPALIRQSIGNDGASSLDYGSGFLVIVPSKNVQLKNVEAMTSGLIADSQIPTNVSEWVPSELLPRVLTYRFQSTLNEPKWGGTLDLLPQQVTASSQVKVELSSSESRAIQTISALIENESLKQLKMIVDRTVLQQQSMIVTLNGSPVSIREIAADPADPRETSVDLQREAIVELLQTNEMRGRVEIKIETRSALAESNQSTVAPHRISLTRVLLPSLAQFVDSSLQIEAVQDLDIDSVIAIGAKGNKNTGWNSARRTESIRIETDLRGLEITLDRLSTSAKPSVVLERAWLQTAFNAAQRRDRLVLQLRTEQDRLRISMPDQEIGRLYEVLVDGQRSKVVNDNEQKFLIVEIPSVPNTTHVIELWSEAGRPSPGQPVTLKLPTVEGAEGVQRFFWELVLPENEHLVIPPHQMTAEWNWSWVGQTWRRVSPLGQEDLEAWSGGTTQLPLPAQANRYVLSTFGPQKEITFIAAPKTWLWAPVGAFVIFCSVMWTMFRWTRNPVVLTCMLIAIGALAIVAPDLAVMAAQMVVIAIAFALIYLLTQWAIDRRVRRRSIFTTYPVSVSASNAASASGERSAPSTPSSPPPGNAALPSVELRP